MRVGEVSPLVIDGVMYFHSGSTLFAVDAASGEPVWTFEAEEAFTGGGRGPAYGDGRIYAYGQTIMYAVDARTGVLVDSFGRDGMLSIINEALSFKYPDTYPPTIDPRSIGYSMTNPPAYRDGTLYVGLPFSDSLLPGGLLVAARRRDGGRQVGVQQHSPGAPGLRLGDLEGHLEQPGGATAGASGRSRPSMPSWGWSTSTPPTRRRTTTARRARA